MGHAPARSAGHGSSVGDKLGAVVVGATVVGSDVAGDAVGSDVAGDAVGEVGAGVGSDVAGGAVGPEVAGDAVGKDDGSSTPQQAEGQRVIESWCRRHVLSDEVYRMQADWFWNSSAWHTVLS